MWIYSIIAQEYHSLALARSSESSVNNSELGFNIFVWLTLSTPTPLSYLPLLRVTSNHTPKQARTDSVKDTRGVSSYV